MKKSNDKILKNSPWLWIPSLYIAEGLPYFAVNTLSVLLYVKMGVGLAEMAFFTGWLYLPWVIKPFWSPVIDIFKSKKWWTVTMELLIAVSMAGIAFFLPFKFFFSATLVIFWLMAFFSATHDVSADGFYMIALNPHEQAAFVGVRSTFYRIASVIGQGGLVILAGYLELRWGDISAVWSTVFVILSFFFFLISIYHWKIMPSIKSGYRDENSEYINENSYKSKQTFNFIEGKRKIKNILKDFVKTFITFFNKKDVFAALAFMMFYRLPEALCLKLVQPFFLSPIKEGGLGLSTLSVGFINGTMGVIALLAGGIIGGISIAKTGLKKSIWPMAFSLTLPCFFYCLLAIYQPQDMLIISIAVAIEQFGYGFGFTAYMLYLIYFSRGEYQTSHYAFCTAFMAIGMMVPGMAAGWIFDIFSNVGMPVSEISVGNSNGFINFFWIVMLSCIITYIVTSRIKIDPHFGKNEIT